MVEHDVLVRGLGARNDSAPPLILQRTDENVIGVLIETLETEDAYAAVSGSKAKTKSKDGWLRLYQPVHRTFHVALVEVVCNQPGRPRLDPAKIDSAGLVIRRVARAGLRPNQFTQGWMSVGKKLRGWARIGPEDEVPDTGKDGTPPKPRKLDRDPDPTRRPAPSLGAPELGRALVKANLEDGAEDVTDLFVVPPQVCEKSGKTILFGLIPTVSSEMSEQPAPAITAAAFDVLAGQKDELKDSVLPVYLKTGTGVLFGSLALRYFTGRSAAQYGFFNTSLQAAQSLKRVVPSVDPNVPDPAVVLPSGFITNENDKKRLDGFLDFLRFLRVSLDVWGKSAESKKLRSLLSEILVPYSEQQLKDKTGRKADEVLAEAASALVAQTPGGATSFRFPYRWPAVSQTLADKIYKQMKTTLAGRLSALQPGVPRFEDPTARYYLRAFIRVKRDDGCPPDLVWSKESEPYVIVPWYENGALPPIQIQLPDISSENVKNLLPNVAFKMPRRLFNFLNTNNTKDLIDGKGSEGLDVGLMWICSFNISIIFVLAFIVMFMFLIILNIVFWWLPFIRICFPLPTVSERADS